MLDIIFENSVIRATNSAKERTEQEGKFLNYTHPNEPLIKKRFVMAGSSTGTSIASKYLSKALPQKLPVRILGTTVLGRAIGRVVPYVGWTLLAIDIVEIIIEYSEYKNNNQKGFKGGFGGGSFSGGGAGSKW